MTKLNWNRPIKSDGLQITGKKPKTTKTTSSSPSRKSPLDIHRHHKIHVVEGPIETKKPGLAHAGRLMCSKCNVMIKWATQAEVDLYNDRYKDQHNLHVTYQGFIDRVHQPKQVKDIRVEYMYLVVTYQDKDQVKALGAKWDETHRLWYVPTSTPHLQKLKPWIHESDQIRLGLKSPSMNKLIELLKK
ncbi:hypothetical protein UFOVP623_2 [uncultured Caudovirales phage]|uniref:DUF5710 domain-containing protein n=1 Tax=uncultured Caudovirales phage TaxID=2100421 RepID=A0A6J5ND17_9CAUD|nr:hypothetical protein UFOVP623_2 [uncultured Caudovirales phage]